MMPRAALHPLDDLSSLTSRERAALVAWRAQHGTLALTREPGPGRSLLRFLPTVVPLVETFDRATCGRLVFARKLREAGRLER